MSICQVFSHCIGDFSTLTKHFKQDIMYQKGGGSMAIHCRLSAILGEKRMKMIECSRLSGVSNNTIVAMYHDLSLIHIYIST